jgi:hypothetical protein
MVEVNLGYFGTCWVYALRHAILFEAHIECFGTWFDAYHGDFEHMISRIFLEILAWVLCGCINFDDDDISISMTIIVTG